MNLIKNVVESKKLGFSDQMIAKCWNCCQSDIYEYRKHHLILPSVKQIDIAGEFPPKQIICI